STRPVSFFSRAGSSASSPSRAIASSARAVASLLRSLPATELEAISRRNWTLDVGRWRRRFAAFRCSRRRRPQRPTSNVQRPTSALGVARLTVLSRVEPLALFVFADPQADQLV